MNLSSIPLCPPQGFTTHHMENNVLIVITSTIIVAYEANALLQGKLKCRCQLCLTTGIFSLSVNTGNRDTKMYKTKPEKEKWIISDPGVTLKIPDCFFVCFG